MLKLELKELSEVKYLWVYHYAILFAPLSKSIIHRKPDAILPEYPCPSNTSHYKSLLLSSFGDPLNGEYNVALSDPERWVVNAEERVAWSTSKDLLLRTFGEPPFYLKRL